MSGPQLEDGYFKVANEWWDALVRTRIPGNQMQCVLYILRRTYGYRQKETSLRLSQFVGATGIRKPHVCRALNLLKSRKIIITKKGNEGCTTYKFNKNYCEWEPLPKMVTLPKMVKNVTKKETTPIKNKSRNKKKEHMSGKKPDGDGQEKVKKVGDLRHHQYIRNKHMVLLSLHL